VLPLYKSTPAVQLGSQKSPLPTTPPIEISLILTPDGSFAYRTSFSKTFTEQILLSFPMLHYRHPSFGPAFSKN
jgi:hypothetical protein